ncbi:hypothetical protein KBZ21_52965, partial [Streptomyces sp. A73]|nr:hypothetical protein [Streptomyces sp. A73]
NCPDWALAWRQRVLDAIEKGMTAPRQLSLLDLPPEPSLKTAAGPGSGPPRRYRGGPTPSLTHERTTR